MRIPYDDPDVRILEIRLRIPRWVYVLVGAWELWRQSRWRSRCWRALFEPTTGAGRYDVHPMRAPWRDALALRMTPQVAKSLVACAARHVVARPLNTPCPLCPPGPVPRLWLWLASR